MKMWKVMALAMVLMVTCSAVPAMAHGPRRVVVVGPAWRRAPVVAPRVVYRAPVVVSPYVPVYPVYRPTVIVPQSYYMTQPYYVTQPGVEVNIVRGGFGLHIGY
jgi:hypothetical protein